MTAPSTPGNADVREALAEEIYIGVGWGADDPWGAALARRRRDGMTPHTKSQLLCLSAADRVGARLASLATPEQVGGEGLLDAIHSALCDYRLSNMFYDEDSFYPLVDLCSNEGTTIDTGREELRLLADHIVSDKRVEAALSPPPVSPAGWREGVQEACDLLAERIHGNQARSPGHNARLILQRLLAAPTLKEDRP